MNEDNRPFEHDSREYFVKGVWPKEWEEDRHVPMMIEEVELQIFHSETYSTFCDCLLGATREDIFEVVVSFTERYRDETEDRTFTVDWILDIIDFVSSD